MGNTENRKKGTTKKKGWMDGDEACITKDS
jgi:hypothetical protein